MTIAIDATYENGVLKPSKPIPLKEGTRVEVVVTPSETSKQATDPAGVLAAIASLPLENTSPFSGQDHDSLLYMEGAEGDDCL